MATLTAQILVGTPHPYHGGLTYLPWPRAVWLSENDRPAWLRPEAAGPWPAETRVDHPRIPYRPDHILEDGLAFLCYHVLGARPGAGGVAAECRDARR